MTTTTDQVTTADPPGAGPSRSTPPRKKTSGGGGLGRYVLVRFLLIIPTVFILVTTVFVVMRSTGDPITAALGGRLRADQLAERIHEAGYDRPLVVQYLEYLGGILRGDFGTTISDNRPVSEVLTTYGAATLELNLERSAGSHWFEESRLGPATQLVPQCVDGLLAQG